MARKINVPGVGEVTVPSSATDAEIIQFAQKVQEAGSVKAAYEKAIAERPGAFMSGVYGAGSDLSATLARATQEAGLNPAVDFYSASESLGQRAAQYTPTIGDYQNIGGIGDAFTYLGELAAQSAPRMLATGAATYFGGPRAGFAVAQPMFTGSNLRRQAEEQNIPLSETQLGPAALSAIPQAALELIPFEGRLFQMFKSASEPVKRSMAREIVARIPGTAASEALTETSQQAIEILQANPDKLLEMDDATVNELINAAVGGAVLGGVLGAGSTALNVRAERQQQESAEQLQSLKDTIQKEADEGRSIDIRSETNLGVEALQLKQASANLEVKPIKKVIEDKEGNKREVDAFTIRDLGDKSKGKVNIGEFANEEAAKQAVAAYQAIVAKPTVTPPSVAPQAAPETPQPSIKLEPTIEAKKPVQPPAAPAATTTPPGVGKAASELPKVPERPVPEAPATFDKQREALQRETRAAMLYNTTDKVPPKLVNPRIKRIKLDDGRTIDFNRTKFTEAQVRDAVANNRLNEILELGPFNREEAVASELRGNAPVAVVERTPEGVEVKAAAGTTETAPAQVQALEQTKTAPENKIVVEPVQDLVAGRLAPELTADERVAIWKSVAPQAESFRDLTPDQQNEYFSRLKVAQDERAKKPVMEEKGGKKLSATPAAEPAAEPVPAVAVLASRPELADKVGESLKKRLSSMGLGNVAFKLQTAVKSGEFGRYGQGVYDPATKTIEISLSAVDPKATDEEFIARLSEIVDHEAIHAVVDLGVLTKEEFSSLLQKAGTTKYPGSSFTYLERAFATYSTLDDYKNTDGTVNRLSVAEEAVAEMFRDWNAGRLKVEDKPRGLFTRMREFFRRVRVAANDAGFAKVFEEIKSGEMAKRQAAPTEGGAKKLSTLPSLGTAGGVDREAQKNLSLSRATGFNKEYLKRTPELQEAVVKLGAGEITQQEYERIVDTYRPVMPFQEVPAPTPEETARKALSDGAGQSPEKAAKYGIPSSVLKDGDDVQIRLDIPSYTGDYKAWVVTVHAPRTTNPNLKTSFDAGATIGYESVAVATDVYLGVNQESAFAIAKGVGATGKPVSKGTIATMLGKWKNASPEEAYRMAQEAMNDSSWRQVGMDPFRHAYFYDRKTMEPIYSADMVIQIGPLVLAKNANGQRLMSQVKADASFVQRKFSIPARLTGDSEQEFKQWWKSSKAVDRNGKPRVYYNGRTRPLREGQFNRGASGALPGEEGPYYFSPDAFFASDYATHNLSKGGDRKKTETGTMYPVFLSVQNPWDYEKSRNVDDVIDYIAEGLESGRIPESDLSLLKYGVPETTSLKKIGVYLEKGDWEAIELPAVQRAIRDLGFDGFYLVEDGVRNLAVYKPQQIKSIYNQFEPGTATSRKLSIAPQISPSTQDRQKRAFGLFPYLRSAASRYFTDHSRLIHANTKPHLAEGDLANLDMLLARHPNTLASEEDFANYMADILGKQANQETGVPLVPYNAVKIANDPSIIEAQLRSLTPGQLSQANDGLREALRLRAAYQNGSATIEHTGKLLLWGILSRGVSPFVQESMFLDAVNGHGNVGGVGRFIEAAAKGEFNLEEYNEWLDLVVPEGATGAGSSHNLGAFGETTLTKLQERLPNGQTLFERIHEIISDYSLSGKEARREFHKVNTAIGVNNKVISFMLLVSGRSDVLVLDRVQMRNQFDDGRFEGYNLYDGEKIRPIKADGTEGKAQVVSGTAIADLGDGIMGLAYYEALERDLEASIRAAYAAVGRGSEASLGRYHWESWVASSAQEVDHGTITGIINDALGQIDPYGLVTTREGKYDNFLSGAKYGYTKEGQPYVALPDGLGNNYVFTPKDAKEVVKGYKRKRTGIIDDPDTFRVSEGTTGAWYERPEINREALRDYLAEQIERRRNFVEPVSKPSEEQPDVYRPRLGRGRLGKVTPGKTASDIADKYIKKLSVAPAYNNVKQFTQADVDKVVEGLNYGAGIDYIQKIVDSGVVKRFVPERFRPTRRATSTFMANWADKMISVGEMIDYIRKNGGKVTDAMDVYMQEELMHGAVSEDLAARENGLYKNLMDFLKSSGVKLKATEEEAKRGDYGLEDYLYARHAGERNQRIRDIGNKDPEKGSGMTDLEAQEILDAVNKSPKKAQILKAAALFDKIVEDTNRVRIESGLTPDFSAMEVIDENGNKVIADMRVFKYYAPLRGFLEENLEYGVNPEEELRARVGSGLNVRGREDKQAMGRKSRASDIVAHAILQNSEAVIRGAKNRVGNSLVKLVETNPKQAEEFGVKLLKKAPTKAVINKNGVIQTIVDPMFKMRPDILIVKAMPDAAKGLKGGEQVVLEINNEALQKALIAKKVAGSAMAEKILSAAQWVNRAVAMVNTGLNPEFMLTNFPRDLQTALVNIEQYQTPGIRKKIMKDVMPAMKGAWNVMRDPDAKGFWEDAFREFKQQGGMTSGMAGIRGIEERINNIGQMMKDPRGSYQGRAIEAGKSIVGFLEDMNGAVENAIRLSVYKNLADNGFTKQRAAQASKNLTVNFDKRGEYGSVFNALYLFFNASVQGTLAMGIAAARSPRVRKIISGIIVLGIMQDVINSILSPEDDDNKNVYDKIPDYKLRTNLIIMEPFGITERGFLSIPLPYGYNAFFNMGRSLSRRLRGEYSTMEATNNIMGTFVDAFNPIGGTENLLNAMSPTIVDPLVSLYLNQDFTGRKIYPEPFPGATPKSDSNTYWTTTSPLFKSLTQFLNSATGGSEYVPGMIDLSPDVVQYLFEYATGGAGAFALRTIDTPANVIIPLLKGDLDEIEMNNVPVFRKLVGNVSDRVITEGYMQNANYLLSRGKELEAAVQSGDAARVKETREKYKEEIRVYPQVKSLVNRRNKIASDLRKLRENPRIPEDQKRVRVDQMQKQIVEITSQVNSIYEKIADKKSIGVF